MLVLRILQRILRISFVKPACSLLPLLALRHPFAGCIVSAQNALEEWFVCDSENWELNRDLRLGRAHFIYLF